ncbi:Hsp33 family molecular chaperone HslO [Treponema sp.]|uniref:Hsp33 family molecular chaperone HslO n=1 Tax=Treponema sp. TaxID=166 RepID=UPI003EFDBC90
MIKAQINDSELIEHIGSLEDDGMSVFVMADGRARGALFHGTKFVNQMRAQHGLGILETMVLGQASICVALMIPTMKGKEHLTWRYDTDGPAKGFSVEADSSGYVRGFLYEKHIPVEKPLESWDLSPFLGNGTMTVSKIHPGDKSPQTSSVEILYRNITKDLAWFFQQSEQISTAFSTSIFMDPKGRVTGAGGLFVQVMPETGGTRRRGSSSDSSADQAADNELVERIENAFSACPSLGKWFSEKGKSEDIVYGLFREFNPEIAVRRSVLFDCPCSQETFRARLGVLPAADLEKLKKDDEVEAVCWNCGSVYRIPVSML